MFEKKKRKEKKGGPVPLTDISVWVLQLGQCKLSELRRSWRTRKRLLAFKTLPVARIQGNYRAIVNQRSRTAPRANLHHHRQLTSSRSVSVSAKVGPHSEAASRGLMRGHVHDKKKRKNVYYSPDHALYGRSGCEITHEISQKM